MRNKKMSRITISLLLICFIIFGAVPNVLAYANSPFLSNIVVENGILSRSFHPNVFNYDLIPNIGYTSVTLTASLDDPAAQLTINGEATNTITLSLDEGGVKQAVFVVTSANLQHVEKYTIILKPRSNNANLSNINVFGDILSPSFNPNNLNYYVTSQSFSYCTVSVTVDDPFASVSINGEAKTTIRLKYNDSAYPTVANIFVTAADGITSKKYVVEVTEFSNNAELKYLQIQNGLGTIYPTFNPANTNYTACNNSSTAYEFNLMFSPADKWATVKVNGQSLGSNGYGEYIYRIGVSSNLPATATIEVLLGMIRRRELIRSRMESGVLLFQLRH